LHPSSTLSLRREDADSTWKYLSSAKARSLCCVMFGQAIFQLHSTETLHSVERLRLRPAARECIAAVGAGDHYPGGGELWLGCGGSRDGQHAEFDFHGSIRHTLGGISAETQGAANLDFTVAKGGSCASGVTSTSCTVQVRFLPTAPAFEWRGGTYRPKHSAQYANYGSAVRRRHGADGGVWTGIITTFAGDYAKGPGYSGDGGRLPAPNSPLPGVLQWTATATYTSPIQTTQSFVRLRRVERSRRMQAGARHWPVPVVSPAVTAVQPSARNSALPRTLHWMEQAIFISRTDTATSSAR